MMLQRAGGVQRDEGEDRVGPELVRQRGGAEQDRIGARDGRDDEEAEEAGRNGQRRSRDDEPARDDRDERQRVEAGLDHSGEGALPGRAGDSGGRYEQEPAREPRDRQRERDEA